MGKLIKERRYISDNPTFIRLIQITRDDTQLGNRLKKILMLDPFHRQQAIRSIVDVMRTTNAPDDMITATALLLDDAVADRALEIISRKKTEK